MDKSRVVTKKAEYDYGAIRPLVFEMLDSFIQGRIRPDSKVVIKPNLLSPETPDKAITTHPVIVRCVAEYVLAHGARPRICDSPGMGGVAAVVKTGGYLDELKGLDVSIGEFTASVKVDAGEPFKTLEIAEEAAAADILINLPKLKSHTQMLMTLGVKNLFGCIVGLKKPEWHYRAGVNRELFGMLLYRIYSVLRPAVTLMDGIVGLEGEGPGKSGVPKHIGVLTAASDAVALDITICRMLGLDPYDVFTIKAARAQGYEENIEVEGELPSVEDFRFPEITPLLFGPEITHRFMRKHLVQRPSWDAKLCMHCDKCREYCPAHAITIEDRTLRFDYDKCIRCYCCIEVCPYGALRTHEPLAGKAVRKILGKSF